MLDEFIKYKLFTLVIVENTLVTGVNFIFIPLRCLQYIAFKTLAVHVNN